MRPGAFCRTITAIVSATPISPRLEGLDSRNVDKAQFCDARVRAHGDHGHRRPTLYPAQVEIGRGGQFTQWGAGLWAPRADRSGQL